MPQPEIDIDPITHITADAIGKPGKRVFYLQAWQEDRVTTLLVEKVQIQTLSVGLEQFLNEINGRYPNLVEATDQYDKDKMHIQPPVDPLFRVGELGLAYDADRDRVLLVTREVIAEGQDPEESRSIRFWCTRSQILAMCRWGLEVVSHGRPTCTQCGEPMDPEGHFCPKKNGHKH
jgi:uncharacterized repeat protein (TIGR03847 family)